MNWFSIFDAFSPSHWREIEYLKKEFPEPIDRINTATGAKTTVSVYDAVREVQLSMGKSFEDGWAGYAVDLRDKGAICTRDGSIIFMTRTRT